MRGKAKADDTRERAYARDHVASRPLTQQRALVDESQSEKIMGMLAIIFLFH